MKLAFIIRPNSFDKWRNSYPAIMLFLGALQNKFQTVDIYTTVKDELFEQAFKNYSLIYQGEPPENYYDYILSFENSVLLSEYNFVDTTNYNYTVNYITSKNYNSNNNFYYCTSEVYFNKINYNSINIIVDYICIRNI